MTFSFRWKVISFSCHIQTMSPAYLTWHKIHSQFTKVLVSLNECLLKLNFFCDLPRLQQSAKESQTEIPIPWRNRKERKPCSVLSTSYRFFVKNNLCSTTKPNGGQLIFVLSLDIWFSIRDNEWVRNLVWTSRWLIHYTHKKQREWLGPRCTDKKRQEHHDKPQVFEVLLKKDYLKNFLDVVSWVWLKQYI